MGLARRVKRLPRDGPALHQGLLVLEGCFRLGEIAVIVLVEPSLSCSQIRLGLICSGLIRERIDFRAELPSAHFRVAVAIERSDHAGHASTDRRGGSRIDDTARGHDADDRASLDLLRQVANAAVQGPVEPSASES